MSAAYDYHDGVVHGAQILHARLRQLDLMGIKLTDDLVRQTAEALADEYGGEGLTDGEIRERARVL